MNKAQELTRLVLLRHGQSIWNQKRHFTGWSDVALSPQGEAEAKRAGQLLKQAGFIFDACFCSELKRANDTLSAIQLEMGLYQLPTYRTWRLNERHYGALQGMRPWDAIRKFGMWPTLKPQIWFSGAPPLLTLDDPRAPVNQQRYAALDHAQLPLAESMQQALERVKPFWQETVMPEIKQGKRLLIVSHQGLLKLLVMQLEELTGTQAMRLSIKTGSPLCYELDGLLKPVNRYYLPQPDSLNQGR